MIFHVQRDLDEDVVFKRSNIQSIMFFNKILISTETRYWFTELEIIDIIWVIRKIRHLIDAFQISFTIIFIDHAIASDIVKQTFLNTTNFDKLNLRLIRVSQYFSSMNIEIRVRLEKFHVVFDALFKLLNITNMNEKKSRQSDFDDIFEDLNAFYAQTIIKRCTSSYDVQSTQINDTLDIYLDEEIIFLHMSDDFNLRLKNNYLIDSTWNKIIVKIKLRFDSMNIFDETIFDLWQNFVYYCSEDKIKR
jgi:hypothetical protein